MTSAAVCTLLFLSGWIATVQASRSYCLRQYFNVTCGDNKVILMTSASYGRIRESSHCITKGYQVGCSKDVLPTMHSWCSGRQHCQFPVRKLMDVEQPCPKDLTPYLEADYTCKEVIADDQKCALSGSVRTRNVTGFLSRDPHVRRRSGSPDCPWEIEVARTQTIRFNLLNQQYAPANNDPQPATQDRCTLKVVFRENKYSRKLTLCDFSSKEAILYESDSNKVSVSLESAWGSVLDQNAYLIHYEAVGCPQLVAPPNGWVQQSANMATVLCNDTGETWYLSCKDNQWLGDHENHCGSPSSLDADASHLTNPDATFPYGILIAVIIGVLLGAAVGSFLLGIVYMFYRRKRRSSRSSDEIFPHVTYGGSSDQRAYEDNKNFYPVLLKQNPSRNTGEYTYGYGVQASVVPAGHPGRGPAGQYAQPRDANMAAPDAENSHLQPDHEHIYESASFLRNRPGIDGPLPVYYELEAERAKRRLENAKESSAATT